MNRWLVIIGLMVLPSVSEAAVSFSEIAWMGNGNSANDEWIELYNDSFATDVTDWVISDGMNLEVVLAGTVGAGQYAVLERTDDDSAPGTAFLIYTGSLTNTGATLTLRDANGNLQDQVAGGENWENIGGDNTTKETAQYSSTGWVTAVATPGSLNATESSESNEQEVVDSSEPVAKTTTKRSNSKSTKKTQLELKDAVLELQFTAPERAYVNQAVNFTIEPSGISKRLLPSVTYNWNFGDMSQSTGKDVSHSFKYPGTYVVFVEAGYARHNTTFRHEITVLPVRFSITRTRKGDIQINNDAKYEIDLSGYQIQARQMVTIPENTILLPGATITIPHESVQARVGDVVVLSDTENVILATHGVQVSALAQPRSVEVTPAVISYEPREDKPLVSTTDFNFAALEMEAVPVENESDQAVQAATGSPTTAQLEPGSSTSLPKDSLMYFGLAGVVALGFLGVFAGRIRTG